MNYHEWRPIYEEIIQDFSINEQDDIKSARLLDQLLDHHISTLPVEAVKPLIYNQEVIVCGAGPSLVSFLEGSIQKIDRMTCIAADGATSALLEYGRNPDIIVSDLDGYLPDLIQANKKGSVIIIHAHGDNSQIIDQIISSFSGPTVGTTQTDPSIFSHLSNVGGFTDGDRAVFLADHFQASMINIVGFDFTGEIGRYSFSLNKDIAKKKRKLYWCEKLLGYLDQSRIKFL
jgi:uncharacterized Rossmann fold enzyme